MTARACRAERHADADFRTCGGSPSRTRRQTDRPSPAPSRARRASRATPRRSGSAGRRTPARSASACTSTDASGSSSCQHLRDLARRRPQTIGVVRTNTWAIALPIRRAARRPRRWPACCSSPSDAVLAVAHDADDLRQIAGLGRARQTNATRRSDPLPGSSAARTPR